MPKPTALVTGAGGEMGHLLLPELEARGYSIVALDLRALPEKLAGHCASVVRASVVDDAVIRDLVLGHRPTHVFHLAALLSGRGEQEPELAHSVNVDGTVGLIRHSRELARERGHSVPFLFPSSIAVYGLHDGAAKQAAGPVREQDWNFPLGIYGCNKLYCEMLGAYFTRRALSLGTPGLDFRAIRFPGLISAETVPSGGTSDYIPEMIHAAARGEPYACFVRPETRLPFMTMPDAVDAFVKLAQADSAALTQRVYNIRAFSPSAAEVRDLALEAFPQAEITFEPDPPRQAIVDSWPADVDDSPARRDWGLDPRHGLLEAFRDYLLPALRTRYGARV